MNAPRFLRLGGLACALLLAAGCASLGGAGRGASPEDRAQARWDLLVAGDYAAAYEYLSPGYRAVVPREAYETRMRNRTVLWNRAEVREREGECEEEELCTVRVDVFYEVRRAVAGSETFSSVQLAREQWVRLDGAWYFVPDGIR